MWQECIGYAIGAGVVIGVLVMWQMSQGHEELRRRLDLVAQALQSVRSPEQRDFDDLGVTSIPVLSEQDAVILYKKVEAALQGKRWD